MVARVVVVGDALADAGACVSAPLPAGDPGRVRAAARRASALAHELRTVSAQLIAASGSDLWRGEAQQAFAAAMHRNAPKLDATADRYDAYVFAMQQYAVALDVALTSLPFLARQIGVARDELIALRSMPVADSSAGVELVRRRAEVERELARCVQHFRSAHDAWVDCLERADRSIRSANDHDPTRDLHGWSAFRHNTGHMLGGVAHPFVELVAHPSLHSLSEALGALAGDLATLGLAFMVVFPPAAGLCFTAATFLSAAKLATDAGRAANGESVSAAALAFDALDSVPVVGRAGRGIAGFRRTATHEAEDVALRELPVGLPETRGIEGDGFVLGGHTRFPRKINWRPDAEDPQWGFTKLHLAKHLWDEETFPKFALKRADPMGNANIWLGHLQELAVSPVSRTFDNGVIEIRGKFPKTDGSGHLKLGLRLFERPDGSFDFVTMLTNQK